MLSSKKIYSLELLRFYLASLVFFGHYVHFYMHYSIPNSEGYFFKINPTYGAIVVPMFFMMSGAIFAHTYFDKVASMEVRFSDYMRKRFARLYPLHLSTLIAVAVLQYIYSQSSGKYFIYQFNNLKTLFYICSLYQNGDLKMDLALMGRFGRLATKFSCTYVFLLPVCLGAFKRIRF